VRGYLSVIGLLTCLVLELNYFTPALASDQGQDVNSFFKMLVSTMTNPNTTAAHLAELVSAQRSTAEKCLPLLKTRAQGNGPKAAAYRMVSTRLEEILLLSGSGLNCGDTSAQRLREAATTQLEIDDKIFYLARLVRLCPGNAELLVALGDAYYRLRQFGMAADTYQKALNIRDDSDTRRLLAKAREELNRYVHADPVTERDVRRLFAQATMGPEDGLIVRKVEVVNAIQANQIRFDPWSSAIKDEFTEQLKAMGKVVRDEFRENPTTGLLIEGHTDRRGPLDRNDKLSADRAESIKGWLVDHYHLDPSRLRTAGYGPRRPFAASDDEAGWALNRRVEFKKLEDIGSQQ
jgi:outer membrane protein OmpA-like peptidoglycan-associated protein